MPWVIRDPACVAPAYPVIFAIGIFTCLFSPAKFSIIPNLVENRHLLIANSLIASSALLSVLAGTALGGIIFDSMGFQASLYLNAATYLFSACALWKLTVNEKKRPAGKGMAFVFTDIKEGMKYLCRDGRLIILIFFGAFFWLLGISFYIVLSDFAGKVWGFTSLMPLGLIFSLLGGGLVTGAVLTGKYGDRVKRNILYTGSVLMLACGIIVVAVVSSYTAASCTVFFVGIAGGAFLAPINADIQKITPDELRGRSFACKDIIMNATMIAPIPVIGKLTTFIAAREMMLSVGIGGLLAGIFVAWQSVKLNAIQEFAREDR
jgi:Arabinose efflux permease